MPSPLLLIHGFTGEPRSWQPLVEQLGDRHEVFAPATLGHAGGPPPPPSMGRPREAMLDALEADMDARGWETAHLVGSSLGGQLALELAGRGRARSVVALAPGGGWTEQRAVEKVAKLFDRTRRTMPLGVRWSRTLAARPRLRRLALRDVVANGERIPPHIAHRMITGAAECTIFDAIIEDGRNDGWRRREIPPLDVPVRVVWGTADRILPLGKACGHWRETLQDADWVELDGAGHLPWLDEPRRVAELVLDWTARADATATAAA